MLRFVKWDLIEAALDGHVDTIIHQCNCFHKMYRGFAAQVVDSFPLVKQVDLATEYADRSKMGTYSMVKQRNVTIFNVYAQFRTGGRNVNNTEYDMLAKGLKSVGDFLRSNNPSAKIGMPRVGCHLGGSRWLDVRPIIERTLHDLDVVIYTPLEKYR